MSRCYLAGKGKKLGMGQGMQSWQIRVRGGQTAPWLTSAQSWSKGELSACKMNTNYGYKQNTRGSIHQLQEGWCNELVEGKKSPRARFVSVLSSGLHQGWIWPLGYESWKFCSSVINQGFIWCCSWDGGEERLLADGFMQGWGKRIKNFKEI